MSDKTKAERQYHKAVDFYAAGKLKKAVKWIRKAAGLGYPDAQYNLGAMYANGKGVEQSYIEAAVWYHKAADQGHARAQYNLGGMYFRGHGFTQSTIEAAKWFRLAEAQSHVEAQSRLKELDAAK